MTDAELVARLREFDPHTHELEVVDEAADRIEALLDERDKLLGAQILDRSAIRLQKQKREAAEAALKEAVVLMGQVEHHLIYTSALPHDHTPRKEVRAFLAKHGSQK